MRADPSAIATKARLMLVLVAQFLPLIEQIKAYDKEIANLFLTHSDIHLFESLPGTGKHLAPRWPNEEKMQVAC